MNIQIRQIKGDIVELVYNPKEEDLRVGEIIMLSESGYDKRLVVQIAELRELEGNLKLAIAEIGKVIVDEKRR